MPSPRPRLLKPDSQTPSPKLWLKWCLRLALGLIVVGVLVRWQGASVQKALQNTSPLALLAAVVFYLSTQLISALKWRLLLKAAQRAQGHINADKVSFRECYRFYLIGMFCNLWLPTAVGGDAVRAALAGKRVGSVVLAASSIFVERLTGLCALLLIGIVATINYFLWFIDATSSDGDSLLALALKFIAIGLIGALGGYAALRFSRRAALKLETRSDSKIARLWANVHRALDVYALPQTRRALWKALALSFVFQGSQIGLNVFLARAVGLELPLRVFAWLVPSLSLASMIPLGIGGLGVREASAVAFLNGVLEGNAPVEPGTIIAWSLLWQATLWLSGLPGALAYFAQYRAREQAG